MRPGPCGLRPKARRQPRPHRRGRPDPRRRGRPSRRHRLPRHSVRRPATRRAPLEGAAAGRAVGRRPHVRHLRPSAVPGRALPRRLHHRVGIRRRGPVQRGLPVSERMDQGARPAGQEAAGVRVGLRRRPPRRLGLRAGVRRPGVRGQGRGPGHVQLPRGPVRLLRPSGDLGRESGASHPWTRSRP